MFDCHLHSFFSGDSEMDAKVACEASLKLGLDGLAFTDHLDIDYPNPDIRFNLDYDSYIRFMNELRTIYEGRLKILKGIEVGIQPHVIEESLKVVEKYDYDYVLASVHIVDGIDVYLKEYFEGRTKQQTYARYLEEVLFMVKNFGNFDVMGHIEYVTRRSVYEDKTLRYADYSELIDEIFKAIIQRGKGFEVNTGGCRYHHGKKGYELDLNIIKRYKELGGEIICLGSDAHNIEHIGFMFDNFKDAIAECGFKYLTHFVERKPVFEPIR